MTQAATGRDLSKPISSDRHLSITSCSPACFSKSKRCFFASNSACSRSKSANPGPGASPAFLPVASGRPGGSPLTRCAGGAPSVDEDMVLEEAGERSAPFSCELCRAELRREGPAETAWRSCALSASCFAISACNSRNCSFRAANCPVSSLLITSALSARSVSWARTAAASAVAAMTSNSAVCDLATASCICPMACSTSAVLASAAAETAACSTNATRAVRSSSSRVWACCLRSCSWSSWA
mmetsp:Transcript_13678/g.18753  ORF Transcript_13678/g.18753 Transcript_13678/m.18753 type:complete len:241 (-) Transcript_13678:3164-3886(-)